VIQQGYIHVIYGLLREIELKIEATTKGQSSSAAPAATTSAPEVRFKSDCKAKQNLEIITGRRVTKIKWRGLGQTDVKQMANVIFENGEEFSCKHIIVTLPLGVLKKEVKTL